MRRLAAALGSTTSWAFAAVVAITLYEVAARYLFNAPTSWAQELTVLLCSVAFAVGGAYVQAKDEHIAVTVLVDRLDGQRRTVTRMLGGACGLVFLVGVVIGGWRDAWEALSGWQTTQSAFNSPMPAIVKPTVVAVCVLMAGLVAADLIELARGRRR